MDYKNAGVDIDAANEAVERLKKHVKTTYTPQVLSTVGSFGGLVELPYYKKPVLVSSTDGVGTKIKLAFWTGKHDTVGQDLVNHCVNDILVQGATPLFFMDYIGTGKVEPEIIEQIVKGMSIACHQTQTALVKGEIAEMKDMYKQGEYDIVGAIVGIVEKDDIVSGKEIQQGDVIIGLASNGLHTNGYTLALKVLLEQSGIKLHEYVNEIGCTLQEALMRIHTCYLPVVKGLWKSAVKIKGMAHITGGGLVENIPRILPEECDAAITGSWNMLPIFGLIQRLGNVAEDEMFRVFNMSIGFIVIVSPDRVAQVIDVAQRLGIPAYAIGTIVKGAGDVRFTSNGTVGLHSGVSEKVLAEQLAHTLEMTDFPSLGEKYEGKVRDNYSKDGRRIIIATDRLSAFDRILCTIPFKGQVLTQMARFWFEQTTEICRNHMIDVPDANVMVVNECTALPVEMVVRAYLTGTTTTSAWYNYEKGVRNFCGNVLPEEMKKDQKFEQPILTPSTKAEKGAHDESVSRAEILRRGLVTEKQFDEMARISFALFQRGQEICARQGIILVDTKYEFGVDEKGEIVLIDEIHTPDSSRFWFADSYGELFALGKEQRKIDKEYVRLWLAERGFRGDGEIPLIPDDVKIETARRYIQAYELITGVRFIAVPGNPIERVRKNLKRYGPI
ncbi:MAG TPA: phosphoribosylaminoimidazolesuccinocarboxamide synthase [Candidatus Nanoarchaeia archaeon]|nr:phosphoribosylaminoimidazolesuccinocarboxamide synthase [Candidatus Nanoarchaeia archaeon]